ncbi:MAG: SRPBCC family protein [Polyangiaceae bacterium]
MTTTPAKAEKTQSTFRMTCAVRVNIRATPDRLWALLTDAPSFPRWNSTVKRVGGTIALGQTLELEVPMAPGRTFKPKVTGFEPTRAMEWSEGMAPMFRGVRTYELSANGDGSTDFSMREVFSGVMLPMIKGSLPDFGPVFESYASDLKREAEGSA